MNRPKLHKRNQRNCCFHFVIGSIVFVCGKFSVENGEEKHDMTKNRRNRRWFWSRRFLQNWIHLNFTAQRHCHNLWWIYFSLSFRIRFFFSLSWICVIFDFFRSAYSTIFICDNFEVSTKKRTQNLHHKYIRLLRMGY